jgi:DNA-binding response OmpR family regulator
MPKILLVDDDRNTRILYSRELIEEGYDVLQAAGPAEALELFRSQRPLLVILDLRMPHMDGLEVLSRLLSIDRRVPIILFSAYSFYQDNFLSWAADAFLEKSSDLSRLKDVIRGLLGHHPASSADITEKRDPKNLLPETAELPLLPILCTSNP